MKNNKLSLKAIIVCVLLLIIIGTIYVVNGPMTTELNNLQSEQQALEEDIAALEPYIAQMNIWKQELEALREKKGELVSIPDYDYFKSILYEISGLFDKDSIYSITYGEPQIYDKIVSRSISMSFTCPSYDLAIERLTALNTSTTRYRLTNMTISTAQEGSCSVTIDFIVYEYSEDGAL